MEEKVLEGKKSYGEKVQFQKEREAMEKKTQEEEDTWMTGSWFKKYNMAINNI